MFHWRIVLTAFRALRQNLLRTALAMLGVVIGVGAVVAAVSILEGSQHSMLDQVEALGADQLIIVNGSAENRHRQTQTSSLLPKDATQIEKENPELVAATVPQFNGAGQIKYFRKNTFVSVVGTTASYVSVNDYHVASGRFITPQDVVGKAMVCTLGHKVAQTLFGSLPPVGERVKINGKGFVVVGVMEKKGTLGFIEVDKQVIVPISTAMSRMFARRYLTILGVQCADVHDLPTCMEGVKKTLRASHRIRPGGHDDFMIYTQERMKDMFSFATNIARVVLYGIATISIVVGAIGIMNIMLVSVTERTREIGVRIAVGARRLDILKQFLTEASVISTFGGLIGAGFGFAMANLLSKVTNNIFHPYTRPGVVVLALAMAALVGIISGIYPAIRASRLDPVQALRYE